jgi:DNA helicase II / ATP-dependent DNA helicase PcrA
MIDVILSRTRINPITILDTFSIDADADQRRFIVSDKDTIRLLAPAGSGKTQTIVNRILYKHIQNGTPLRAFLVLTFDNSACASLREKFQLGANKHKVNAKSRPFHGRSISPRSPPTRRAG